MLNQVVLVGRIVGEIKKVEIEEKVFCEVNVSVQRAYKNELGEYETDIVPVILWNGIAQNVAEYCKMGDLVGVKGRLQVEHDKLQVIADKVTFLSSKSTGDED